jgi:uncharacterized membrane protein
MSNAEWMLVLNYVLHYAHVLCVTFWVGSLLYSEIVLWPALVKTGTLPLVQGELRHIKNRRIVGFFIVGTIVSGLARAVANGSLERLYTPYGACLVAGALVGVWMMTWWLCFPPRSMKWAWRAFYASFWIVLALMFAMRFLASAP